MSGSLLMQGQGGRLISNGVKARGLGRRVGDG